MYEINKGKIGALQRQRIEASEGFLSALRWSGLGVLATTLTQIQKDKIEACADANGRTVFDQVSAYVGTASFQDYSSLYANAAWTNVTSSQVLNSSGPPQTTRGAA
jgi:hypothetical protein